MELTKVALDIHDGCTLEVKVSDTTTTNGTVFEFLRAHQHHRNLVVASGTSSLAIVGGVLFVMLWLCWER